MKTKKFKSAQTVCFTFANFGLVYGSYVFDFYGKTKAKMKGPLRRPDLAREHDD